MNKTLIWILVIGLVIIIGYGIYQLTMSSSTVAPETVPMAAGTGGEGSFTTPPAPTTSQTGS
jgi:hypothetical protein